MDISGRINLCAQTGEVFILLPWVCDAALARGCYFLVIPRLQTEVAIQHPLTLAWLWLVTVDITLSLTDPQNDPQKCQK